MLDSNWKRLLRGSEFDLSSLILSSKGDKDDWIEYPYEVGKLKFPLDEGIHNYLHEWWYLNLHLVNLESDDKYDMMLSYFPKQELLPIPMRYFMIIDRKKQRYAPSKKFTFGSLKSSEEKQYLRFRKGFHFDSWIQLNTGFAFEYAVTVENGSNGLAVLLRSRRPPLPVNGNGEAPAGIGGYSFYYSLTRLHAAGVLKYNGNRIPVVGTGWIDHQFGNYHQTNKTETYDWFCLQLDNNVDIICWYAYVDGEFVCEHPIMTIMHADNTVEVVDKDDFNIETLDYWLSPKMKKYGCKWHITEKKHKLDVIVKPVISNQLCYVPFPFEMREKKRLYLVGLYEGSTEIKGSFEGKPVKGNGFAELTHVWK
jgi:predicted secreted hydrolase